MKKSRVASNLNTCDYSNIIAAANNSTNMTSMDMVQNTDLDMFSSMLRTSLDDENVLSQFQNEYASYVSNLDNTKIEVRDPDLKPCSTFGLLPGAYNCDSDAIAGSSSTAALDVEKMLACSGT